MTNHHQVWIYPISVPYRLLYFSTVTPSCVLCLLRLCLFSFHIALKLCPFVPLSFQECPSGVVNEDTFKQIYSQFFPHGGEVCVCVCVLGCLHLCSSLSLHIFLPVYQQLFSSSPADASTYAHYLFNAFDTGHTGSIKFEVCFILTHFHSIHLSSLILTYHTPPLFSLSFYICFVLHQDFVTALSILLRGSVTEKLQWTFNLYDINRDGYINKEVCLNFFFFPHVRLYSS